MLNSDLDRLYGIKIRLDLVSFNNSFSFLFVHLYILLILAGMGYFGRCVYQGQCADTTLSPKVKVYNSFPVQILAY